MANITLANSNVIYITGLDADWLMSTDMPTQTANGPRFITSIQFNPSAADDVFIIRDGVAGPVLMYAKCTGTSDQRIKYFFDFACNPCIDISDSTLGTAANASVIITYR